MPAVVLASALLLAACDQSIDSGPTSSGAAARDQATPRSHEVTVRLPQVKPDPPEKVPSALDDIDSPKLPRPLIDPSWMLPRSAARRHSGH